ncbi:hypothetical protein ACFL3T_05505 [Patescibacteria group bacterium]
MVERHKQINSVRIGVEVNTLLRNHARDIISAQQEGRCTDEAYKALLKEMVGALTMYRGEDWTFANIWQNLLSLNGSEALVHLKTQLQEEVSLNLGQVETDLQMDPWEAPEQPDPNDTHAIYRFQENFRVRVREALAKVLPMQASQVLQLPIEAEEGPQSEL